MAAPEPSEFQWSSFTPFPMNSTAKRFGNSSGGAPHAFRDSSHGKATVTPAPRRTVRREIRDAGFGVRLGMDSPFSVKGGGRSRGSDIQKLRAGNDGFHQAAEAIFVGLKLRLHLGNQRIIRDDQGPSQRERQQLAAKRVQ